MKPGIGSDMGITFLDEERKPHHQDRFSTLAPYILELKKSGLTNAEIAKVLHTKALTIRHWTHKGKKTSEGPHHEFYLNLIQANVQFRIARSHLREMGILKAIHAQVEAGTLIPQEDLIRLGIIKEPRNARSK